MFVKFLGLDIKFSESCITLGAMLKLFMAILIRLTKEIYLLYLFKLRIVLLYMGRN